MSKRTEIIEREFHKATLSYTIIRAYEIPSLETYIVIADAEPYLCQAGSDDSEFRFEGDNQSVTFDIPKDWPCER